MAVKKHHCIMTTYEGPLDEVLANQPDVNVSMDDVTGMLEKLTFMCETIAHLQGREREILPTTEEARALIKTLKG